MMGKFCIRMCPSWLPKYFYLFIYFLSPGVDSGCPHCVLISNRWPSLVWDLGNLFFPLGPLLKKREHIFVVFPSLFLFHVFPHLSPCGVVANLALQTLPQRGIGALHLVCGDRFCRGPGAMRLHFKAGKRRGWDVACHLAAQVLEPARRVMSNIPDVAALFFSFPLFKWRDFNECFYLKQTNKKTHPFWCTVSFLKTVFQKRAVWLLHSVNICLDLSLFSQNFWLIAAL